MRETEVIPTVGVIFLCRIYLTITIPRIVLFFFPEKYLEHQSINYS